MVLRNWTLDLSYNPPRNKPNLRTIIIELHFPILRTVTSPKATLPS
ncbi:MAG: hypothetical protein ACTS44_00405 [Candidatus Hodgkinia cicadicola]